MRDALRVLEAEGVLTIQSRSGTRFLKPDLEFARSTYQFRSIIERVAARAEHIRHLGGVERAEPRRDG